MRDDTTSPIEDWRAVWHTSSPDGAWVAQVQRGGPLGGRLLVWHESDHDHPVYNDPVLLAYSAIFGPDQDDIHTWERVVSEMIDRAKT